MTPLTLQLPVSVPTPERMEELYREAAAAEIARRGVWLTLDEAAEYLRISRRSLDRHRVKWGLPVAELEGQRIVLRSDLDAIARAHLTIRGAGPVIEFPSQSKSTAAAAA